MAAVHKLGFPPTRQEHTVKPFAQSKIFLKILLSLFFFFFSPSPDADGVLLTELGVVPATAGREPTFLGVSVDCPAADDPPAGRVIGDGSRSVAELGSRSFIFAVSAAAGVN